MIKIPNYTKGDWYPSDDKGCKDIYVRQKAKEEDNAIFSLHNEGISIGYSHGLNCEPEDQANVDLICAAPKMVEFIKKKAEAGDSESIKFLDENFKATTCDICPDRFVCFTEYKEFKHS